MQTGTIMLKLMMAGIVSSLRIMTYQEIGMTNIPRSWLIEKYRDVETLNYYESVKSISGSSSVALENAMKGIQEVSRDHGRTPVQWDSSENAGFTYAPNLALIY